MVVCLERGADLHMAQLMPLPLTVTYFSKIHIGFTFLVPAHLGSPGQRAIKWVCVCVLVNSGCFKCHQVDPFGCREYAVCVCVCACVRACVRACARACALCNLRYVESKTVQTGWHQRLCPLVWTLSTVCTGVCHVLKHKMQRVVIVVHLQPDTQQSVITEIQGGPKKRGHRLMTIILSILNGFKNFFHWKIPW